MNLISKIVLFLLMAIAPAFAGGHGGRNTTFNPNSYGGGWTTVNCVGDSTDGDAIVAWRTAAIAANPALAKLRLTGHCKPGYAISFTWDGTLGTVGVQNAIIWAYGASIDEAYLGGESYPQNTNSTARIKTVSAGATSVEVITGADASKFAANDIVAVTGLELQLSLTFPPNFQFYEYHVVTNVSGSVITLGGPLLNSYKSTWPVYNPGSPSSTDDGGPATLYKMPPSWNTNVQVFGLTVNLAPGNELPTVGRTLTFTDLNVVGGVGAAPSATVSTWFFYSALGTTEVDKNMMFMGMLRGSGGIFFSSPAPENASITSLAGAIVGTPKNIVINNTTLAFQPSFGAAIGIAPNGYGHGQSIAVDGGFFGSIKDFQIQVDNSWFTSFSAGTFAIPNNSPHLQNTVPWGVPGQKYYFGFASPGQPACNAGFTFTITDVRQDVTNTYYDTDIGSSLPSPSCNGNTYNVYVPYPAATITQKFTGASPDLTVYAAPP